MMEYSSFADLNEKERGIVSDFICQAFIFADYFDCRDDFDYANDEFADFVMEKMTEWEKSDYFNLDMDRCSSIEMFCDDYR